MTKKRSKELKQSVAVIHLRSVTFWESNKEACRYENEIARRNAQQRLREKLFKGKDIRV